jgi:hypothetical protein
MCLRAHAYTVRNCRLIYIQLSCGLAVISDPVGNKTRRAMLHLRGRVALNAIPSGGTTPRPLRLAGGRSHCDVVPVQRVLHRFPVPSGTLIAKGIRDSYSVATISTGLETSVCSDLVVFALAVCGASAWWRAAYTYIRERRKGQFCWCHAQGNLPSTVQ